MIQNLVILIFLNKTVYLYIKLLLFGFIKFYHATIISKSIKQKLFFKY